MSIGCPLESITNLSGKEIDKMLGLSSWARTGMVHQVLQDMQNIPSPKNGFIFISSLSPWPLSDRIEGTPFERRDTCEQLIQHFIPSSHLEYKSQIGFTGHEFKVAAITGGIFRLLELLKNRNVILIANEQNRVLFDQAEIANLDVIEVDKARAREQRKKILAKLKKLTSLSKNIEEPFVVISGAGELLSTSLGLSIYSMKLPVQFIDMGGALAAYHPQTAKSLNWAKAYKRQLSQNMTFLVKNSDELESWYGAKFDFRDPSLVSLATKASVQIPQNNNEVKSPLPHRPIPFIENKIYDFKRISDFLKLSVEANHHANSGPVVSLLEKAVALRCGLPDNRRVVAVSNGTVALHLACGLHAHKVGLKKQMRWVTSAFTFFSAVIGPLSENIVIDCASDGGFDLERLRELLLRDYDGVIFTNVFAQHSNWDDVAEYCRANGKAFVVDNATGLLDRPQYAFSKHAPMEIISAHHTKPWGVGEGGFLICSEDEEFLARKLIDFGSKLSNPANFIAMNAKMSDFAAAAILDRLERMDEWMYFYKQQERRVNSIMNDADFDVVPLLGKTPSISPRAHTPFIHPQAVDVNQKGGVVVLRKYYKPLTGNKNSESFTNAENLYSRIFSLSNAPEMRLVSDDEIINQLSRLNILSENKNR